MAKIHSYICVLALFLIAGQACTKEKKTTINQWDTVDYVAVGKQMDSIRAPYIIDLQAKNKHLIFVGCEHTQDTTHRQFTLIDQLFAGLKPQIAFNEGGQVTRRYPSRKEAILHNGETGCLKFACDRAGIPMMNGDLADSLEFVLMQQKYTVHDLLLYYVMERMIIPYLYGAYGKIPFNTFYDQKLPEWFVKNGLRVPEQEQSFAFYQQLYRRKMGHPLQIALTDDVEKFDYINDQCYYCAVGRASKMVRDSVLLTKIDAALAQYDRVMVTFGHGHALAVEPALKQIMRKYE